MLHSATRLTQGAPWLCGPVLRRVCYFVGRRRWGSGRLVRRGRRTRGEPMRGSLARNGLVSAVVRRYARRSVTVRRCVRLVLASMWCELSPVLVRNRRAVLHPNPAAGSYWLPISRRHGMLGKRRDPGGVRAWERENRGWPWDQVWSWMHDRRLGEGPDFVGARIGAESIQEGPLLGDVTRPRAICPTGRAAGLITFRRVLQGQRRHPDQERGAQHRLGPRPDGPDRGRDRDRGWSVR